MRTIRTLDDAQIVLKDLIDWRTEKDTKSWDLHQNRIKNVGAAIDLDDCVTLRQLNAITPNNVDNNQYYTICWTRDSVVTGQSFPAFIPGKGREGIPYEVITYCVGAPAGASFQVQLQIGGVNLLNTVISVTSGNHGPSVSSEFISPVPELGQHSVVVPLITNAAGASIITIELVVKRKAN